MSQLVIDETQDGTKRDVLRGTFQVHGVIPVDKKKELHSSISIDLFQMRSSPTSTIIQKHIFLYIRNRNQLRELVFAFDFHPSGKKKIELCIMYTCTSV